MKAIFIGGCARSGTTLLGSMIGGAKGAIATPESQFKIDAAIQIARNEISDSSQDILEYFLKHFRLRLWGIGRELSDAHKIVSKSSLFEITKQCVDVYAEKIGCKKWDTWIDHTPDNIKYINLLNQIFPDSYFIHIIRDGRGAFASVKPLEWGPSGVIQGAKWWAQWVAPGLAAEKAFNDRLKRVHYEDLILNPENVIKQICDFADVTFDHSMVKGSGFKVPEYTKNQHELVGRPPDKSVLNKWKAKLSPREIEIFENISGSLLEYLGYELMYGLKARCPSRWERFSEYIFSQTARRLPDKLRKRQRIRKC